MTKKLRLTIVPGEAGYGTCTFLHFLILFLLACHASQNVVSEQLLSERGMALFGAIKISNAVDELLQRSAHGECGRIDYSPCRSITCQVQFGRREGSFRFVQDTLGAS